MTTRPGGGHSVALVLLAAAALGGCGPGVDDPARQPAFTAAELGEQTVLEAHQYLAMSPWDGADAQRGESLYLQCRACHTIEEGGADLAGPNLHGIFGQPAARTAGFPYSQALVEAGFVWTPEAMDAWITNPYLFLPGNRMAYAGMRRPEDRRDLIAWMLRESGR